MNADGSEHGYSDLSASERTSWIRRRRAPRPSYDVSRPQSYFVEQERSPVGELLPTLTILLRSRECPWHCLMCDLWKSTVTHPIPAGAIPAQIDAALAETGPGARHGKRQIKLYNSGSFFDPAAVPPADYPAIGRRLRGFSRVIVECHPRLVGDKTLRFRDILARDSHPQPGTTTSSGRTPSVPQLEVAMGLETVHPVALERLNKRMSLEDFRCAANFLAAHRIDLRAFVLVQPPFVPGAEAVEWATRSIQFAFDCGATAVSIIPTRTGNGALEELGHEARFSPPRLETFETAFDHGLALNRGRVFADLWDLERSSACAECFPARHSRLVSLNLEQTARPHVVCGACGRIEHRRYSATAR